MCDVAPSCAKAETEYCLESENIMIKCAAYQWLVCSFLEQQANILRYGASGSLALSQLILLSTHVY